MFSLTSALLLLLQPQSPGELSLALSTDCTQILPSNASRTHGHLSSTHNMLPSVMSTTFRQNPGNTSPPTRLKRSDYPPNPAGASPRTAGFRYSLFSISPAARWGFFIDHLQRCISNVYHRKVSLVLRRRSLGWHSNILPVLWRNRFPNLWTRRSIRRFKACDHPRCFATDCYRNLLVSEGRRHRQVLRNSHALAGLTQRSLPCSALPGGAFLLTTYNGALWIPSSIAVSLTSLPKPLSTIHG